MIRIRSLFFLLLIATSNAWAQQPAYNVGVDGLACPFCAYGVEKQLQKLDGVAHVETDIKQGQVVVQMLDDKTLERIQVEEAVEKAGFSLRSFEQADEKEES